MASSGKYKSPRHAAIVWAVAASFAVLHGLAGPWLALNALAALAIAGLPGRLAVAWALLQIGYFAALALAPPAWTPALGAGLAWCAAAGAAVVPYGRPPGWAPLCPGAMRTVWTLAALGCLTLAALRPVPPVLALGWVVAALLFRRALPRLTVSRDVRLGRAVLAVSLAIAVAIVELGLRILIPAATAGDPGSPILHAGTFTPHPTRLWTLTPHAQDERPCTWGDEERTFTLDVSDLGLRNRPLAPKAADEFRILLLGDSFTMGWCLEPPDTIAGQLEALFAKGDADTQVTVVNGGVSGYGPWQALDLFLEKAAAIDPDVVVLQVLPANDLANTLAKVGQVMPAYVEGMERTTQFYQRQQAWPNRADQALRRVCRTYSVAMQILGGEGLATRVLRNVRLLPPPEYPPPLPANAPRHPKLEVDLREWHASLESAWDMMTSDIRALKDACNRRGIEFAAYAMPSSEYVCDEVYHDAASIGGSTYYERGKGVRVLQAFYEAEGIAQIDVPRAIREFVDPCGLYIPMDGHLTPVGCGVVAGAIRDFLLATWLPGPGQ